MTDDADAAADRLHGLWDIGPAALAALRRHVQQLLQDIDDPLALMHVLWALRAREVAKGLDSALAVLAASASASASASALAKTEFSSYVDGVNELGGRGGGSDCAAVLGQGPLVLSRLARRPDGSLVPKGGVVCVDLLSDAFVAALQQDLIRVLAADTYKPWSKSAVIAALEDIGRVLDGIAKSLLETQTSLAYKRWCHRYKTAHTAIEEVCAVLRPTNAWVLLAGSSWTACAVVSAKWEALARRVDVTLCKLEPCARTSADIHQQRETLANKALALRTFGGITMALAYVVAYQEKRGDAARQQAACKRAREERKEASRPALPPPLREEPERTSPPSPSPTPLA